MKTPCEIFVWDILPMIRKEFAKNLIKDHGYTQRKTAETLGLTESAVSQYLSKKRGKKNILDQNLQKEIKKSVRKILKGNTKTVVVETCRICEFLKANQKFE